MARLYVPLDVNYVDDPKVMRAGPYAELVYVRSMALAKRLNEDGRIDPCHVRRLCDGIEDPNAVVAVLLEQGLWINENGHYRIAAWLKHNPSAAELDGKREADRVRKASARLSARTDSDVRPDTKGCPPHEVKRNESEENTLGHEFDGWWAAWRNRKDKAAAFRAFKARRNSGVPLDDLVRARDNYNAAEVFTDDQFIKRGATFLNGKDGPWSEYLEAAPPPKAKPNEPVPVGPAYREWVPGTA